MIDRSQPPRFVLGATFLFVALAGAPSGGLRPVAAQTAAPAPTPSPDDDGMGPIADPNVSVDPSVYQAERPQEKKEVELTKENYPQELILRPLTLVSGQGELTIDIPFVAGDGDPAFTQFLQAAYGVTSRLQLGASYAVGIERLSPDEGEDGFVAGRAVSLDAGVGIVRQVAAQARLGFYFDREFFGMGLTVGLPFRITLSPRWAIFGGHDLVRVKLVGHAVDVTDPAYNEAQVESRRIGAIVDSGSVDASAGVLFQVRPDVAVHTTASLGWPDFAAGDQPFGLFAGAAWSRGRDIDIGARVGTFRLDDAGGHFSVAVFAAVRM